MPRIARASVGGVCYHVINRGNARGTVFHSDDDFQTLVDLPSAAYQRPISSLR
jgi:putative transposase